MVTPVFRFFDYKTAIEFYVDWLGFHIDWEDRSVGGPVYMQVSRGEVVLHLTGHQTDSCTGSKAIVEINGLRSYHRLLLQKDYPFMRPSLEKTNWNEKVMQAEVTDPFGNRLVFVEACG